MFPCQTDKLAFFLFGLDWDYKNLRYKSIGFEWMFVVLFPSLSRPAFSLLPLDVGMGILCGKPVFRLIQKSSDFVFNFILGCSKSFK